MASQDKVTPLRPRLSFLISHAFLRGRSAFADVARGISRHADILVDSGAVTNHNQDIKQAKTGKRSVALITLEEYKEACKDYDKWVWGYLTLDEINNPKQTYEQFVSLLDAGVHPTPIMQPSDNIEHLKFYVAHSKNHRLAVGGIAGNTGSNSLNFGLAYYSYLYAQSGKLARIHTLGVLKWPEILQVEGVKYTDTTTHIGGMRFGEVGHYDKHTGFTKLRILNPRSIGDPDKRNRLFGLLAECGLKPADIGNYDNYHGAYSIPTAATFYAYLQFHRHAKERDLTYFFVESQARFISGLLSVLSAAEERHFDYYAAKDKFFELKAIEKSGGDLVSAYIEILERKTAWDTTTK